MITSYEVITHVKKPDAWLALSFHLLLLQGNCMYTFLHLLHFYTSSLSQSHQSHSVYIFLPSVKDHGSSDAMSVQHTDSVTWKQISSATPRGHWDMHKMLPEGSNVSMLQWLSPKTCCTHKKSSTEM